MLSNYDEKTGINYGCISQNSIALEHIDSWYEKDAVYESYVQELEKKVKSGEITEEEKDNNLEYYDNDFHQWYYKDEEYEAEYSESLNAWIILKSPFYTYCRQCSPCVPGAGDLDSPVSKEEYERTQHNTFMYGTVKAYCLPKDFFDADYAKIPYRHYWAVGTDTLVI